MGTRGALGIIVNETEKIAYNHFDSYPSGLGVEVLKWIRGVTEGNRWNEVRGLAEALRVIDDDTPATPGQILELRAYTNWHVNQYSMAGPPGDSLPTEDVEWYNLLHATQGDLEMTLACGYLLDGHTFPLDSLFCEWGYIIDLDASVLEVYRGFQKTLPKAGRWKGRPTKSEDEQNYTEHLAYTAKLGCEPSRPRRSEYKAIELVDSWPLDGVPSDEVFLKPFLREEEE